jgi:20S proteasome subunit beta 6
MPLTASDSTLSIRSFSRRAPPRAANLSVSSYADNGGSVLGIAGSDFIVMAGDTRHTSGYSINSRMEKKVYRLGEDSSLILAIVGFGADAKNVAEMMSRAVDVGVLLYQAEEAWTEI